MPETEQRDPIQFAREEVWRRFAEFFAPEYYDSDPIESLNVLVAAVRAEERSRVTVEQIEATIRAAVRGRLDIAEAEWASTSGFTDAAQAVHRLITGETP